MRVAVSAVPGAGKTRRLRALCEADEVPALFLAYNTQLAAEVQRTLPAHCVCLTFHALCGRCLSVARDDAQLEEAVARAERGELAPRDVPEVRRVLIDEAQDVRELYVRLVRVLGLAGDGMELVVAGDARQLVYDFDEDFPASLGALDHPERAFGGAWTHEEMPVSYRLTRPMAALVNRIFGTTIEVAPRDEPAPPVQVRAPKTAFALYRALSDLLTPAAAADTLLLVDRRAGNRPLRSLLNEVSRAGTPLHLHGVDSDEAPPAPGALRCLSYWSAKGLEADTVVVLLPKSAPANPTYVALTRARRRLVVVLDPREPHAAACQAILEEPEHVDVRGAFASQALEAGFDGDAADSLAQRAEMDPSTRRSLDRFVPPRAMLRCVRVEAEGDEVEAPPASLVADGRDLSRVAVAMCLVEAEARARNGRVRAFEDVLSPTRLDAAQLDAARQAGFVGRSVPRFVPDDALLAPDLRRAAEAAYAAGLATPAQCAEVALAVTAWDNYDHVMRQMRPVEDWADDVRLDVAREYALEVLPTAAEFDTLLMREHRHVRVHASTPERCYHVVWNRTSADEAAAAVRASLHPKRTCALVDLAARSVNLVCGEVEF